MKKGKLLCIVAVLFFNMAALAQAASFQYQLDTEFSGGSEPSGTKPWLTAIFQDTGKMEANLNIVQLTMSASGLSGAEFISSWYFNTNFTNLLFFDYQASESTGPAADNIKVIANSLNADGEKGFGFDIVFDFLTAQATRFNANEIVVYYLSGKDLLAENFNFLNEPETGQGNFYSAAHIQGIPAEPDSGWIAATSQPVPEPATMLLLGIGLTGLSYFGRKKLLK